MNHYSDQDFRAGSFDSDRNFEAGLRIILRTERFRSENKILQIGTSEHGSPIFPSFLRSVGPNAPV